MPQPIEAITTASLSLALDAAALRQQVIAANIANANVPGYTAKTVSFGAVMAGTSGQAARLDAHVVPRLDASGNTQSVQLDAEMAELSLNQLQYQTLVSGLNKQLSMLSLAINDGKN